MADPPPGGTGSTIGGNVEPYGTHPGGIVTTGSYKAPKVIDNFDDLAKLLPSYSEMTMGEVLASPAFNGPDAPIFSPRFYKEFQDATLKVESIYGVPPSYIPTKVFTNTKNLEKVLNGEGLGGSGSVYHPQPYGYAAPDPLGAANALLNQYLAQIDATKGQFNAEMAMKQFEADWAKLGLESKTAEGSDRAQREISEANRRVNVAEEAGRRAQTVGRDYLPYMIPGATSLNLPLIGNMPLNQVNLGQVFSQGGPGNLAQLPSINPNPSVDYGIGAMPGLPQVPQFPTMPNIQDYINKAASGSPPLGWA